MSTVFTPRWRTRPAPVDFGCLPGTNPESPEKPPETPFPGFPGAIPENEPNLQAAPDSPADRGAPVVCYVCRGSDFWAGFGTVVCRRCHPPAPGAESSTFQKPAPGPADPVQIQAGSSAVTTPPRTNGVRGGAA